MKQLRDRVAVVTGGASGIGKGMAERFAAEGMKLVIADVEREALSKAVAELETRGARVIGIECDVASAESVASLAQQTLDAYGAVHVLCSNAGVAGAGGKATWESSLDDWNWVLGVNLMGVIHGIRSFVPIMLEQGEEGHLVNTASIAGLVQGGGIYGVTKHAVVALSESLFNEFRARGAKLGVSVLCPGWVNTRIFESERNRPEAPREDPGELAPQFEMLRKFAEAKIASGLDPKDVGGMVVDAIKAERFYILTHPWQNMIQNRMENILQGRDPVGVGPPGEDWPLQPPEESD